MNACIGGKGSEKSFNLILLLTFYLVTRTDVKIAREVYPWRGSNMWYLESESCLLQVALAPPGFAFHKNLNQDNDMNFFNKLQIKTFIRKKNHHFLFLKCSIDNNGVLGKLAIIEIYKP